MAFVVPVAKNKSVLLFDEIMLKVYYLKQIISKNPDFDVNFLKEKDGLEIMIASQGTQKQYTVFLDKKNCSNEICSSDKCNFVNCPLKIFWRETGTIHKYHSEKKSTIEFLTQINIMIDKFIENNQIEPNYYDYFLNQLILEIGL